MKVIIYNQLNNIKGHLIINKNINKTQSNYTFQIFLVSKDIVLKKKLNNYLINLKMKKKKLSILVHLLKFKKFYINYKINQYQNKQLLDITYFKNT